MTRGEPIKLGSSIEEAQQYYEQRRGNDLAVSQYPVRVNLPDDPARVFERLESAEEMMTPGKDYIKGSAQKDDDLLIIMGNNQVLMTAEHATWSMREKKDGTRVPKGPEPGTAAISTEVAHATGNSAIVAIGRQKGQANKDTKHPLKEAMADIIASPFSEAHLSIHGMRHGLAVRADEERGFSALIGRGTRPSPATNALIDYILEAGRDYGLRVAVNQPFMEFDTKTKRPILTEDGKVKSTVYYAPPHTTRGFAQSVAEELGKGNKFAAVQIELSAAVRLQGNEAHDWPSRRDQELGAYLGLLLVRTAVESVSKLKS